MKRKNEKLFFLTKKIYI